MPLSTLLVVPSGACNPRTGGGQRTRMLFDAMKALGPVSVVQLSDRDGPGADEFFPGAQEVVQVAACDFSARPSGLRRVGRAVRRGLAPWRDLIPDPHASARLSALAASRDAVVFRYLKGFAVSGLNGRDVPCCVDIDDRDDAKFLSYVSAVFGNRLTRTVYAPYLAHTLSPRMARVTARADHVWVAKEEDRPRTGSVSVWPNVPFSPPGDLPPPSKGGDILFVASIGNAPNRAGIEWFLARVWPQIAAAHATVRLRLVGLGDWSGVAQTATARSRVDVVGPVADLGPEYARARMAICPVFIGAGSQIKVIEAAAYGRPIVSSDFAGGGFGAGIAAHLSLAETPDTFARACLGYLDDPERADRAGQALKELQRKRFCREAVKAALTGDIARVVTGPKHNFATKARYPKVTPLGAGMTSA